MRDIGGDINHGPTSGILSAYGWTSLIHAIVLLLKWRIKSESFLCWALIFVVHGVLKLTTRSLVNTDTFVYTPTCFVCPWLFDFTFFRNGKWIGCNTIPEINYDRMRSKCDSEYFEYFEVILVLKHLKQKVNLSCLSLTVRYLLLSCLYYQ